MEVKKINKKEKAIWKTKKINKKEKAMWKTKKIKIKSYVEDKKK